MKKITSHVNGLLVHFHQQRCLKSGGILGDAGGVCGDPLGSPGCLGQKIFEQSCLSVMNLRLGKETLLLLAFNADPLKIASRYPKH